MASAYGSVRVPAGCTVKIGDTIGGLASLGVLKGDAEIGITYDLVKVRGSKAETLIDYIKNMAASAAFEMYQLHLPNIAQLFDGVATPGSVAGTPLTDQLEEIAVGSWLYDRFYPLEHQMGTGAAPTINRVAGSVDTTLELTLTDVLAGDTVTINGLLFTAHATTTTPALREFSISGDDTADAVELAAVINDATYGVPGITATPAVAVVTLSVDTPLVTGLGASSVGGTIVIVGVDELVLDTDYFKIKAPDGKWGIYILDTALVTTESQVITVDSDYTPAASKSLKMGAASAELTPKIVEFSVINNGKTFRIRLWSVTNEAGLVFAFPDADTEDVASLPVTLKGGLDASKATGEQLVEIYDEIGLTV